MIVAIQPAYGDAWTRRQFAATLEHPVILDDPRLQRQLSEEQQALLADRHPGGSAACWGGTRSQATKISQLRRGDLVLYTGQRHVQGVGRVGAVVDNPAFARELWDPHPRRCSFEVAYTLDDFDRVEIPYAAVQRALGTSERDNFQGLRLIRDQRRVDAVHELVRCGVR